MPPLDADRCLPPVTLSVCGARKGGERTIPSASQFDILGLNQTKRQAHRLLLERAQTNGWSPSGRRTGIRIDRANRTIEFYAAKLENGLDQRSIVAAAGALDLAPEDVLFRSGIADWLIV